MADSIFDLLTLVRINDQDQSKALIDITAEVNSEAADALGVDLGVDGRYTVGLLQFINLARSLDGLPTIYAEYDDGGNVIAFHYDTTGSTIVPGCSSPKVLQALSDDGSINCLGRLGNFLYLHTTTVWRRLRTAYTGTAF